MSLRGFYNYAEVPSEPTGSGDNWAADYQRFRERQSRFNQVGRWRAVTASWTRDHGTLIDPDYYIVDHGQEDRYAPISSVDILC